MSDTFDHAHRDIRIRTLLVTLTAFGWLLSVETRAAETPPEPRDRPPSDPFHRGPVDEALDRAVRYLVGLQGEDGSLDEQSRSRKKGHRVERNSTAMTALAAMAIASLGHEAGDPTPEGRALSRALDCVLDPRRQREGYFGSADGSRMYGHGIATLFLAEMVGMGADDAQDQHLRERLQPALELILRSQKVRKDERSRGGWRYQPQSSDADLSVTVWQVMALRAAKNAGINVAADGIEEAAEYIRRSYPSYRADRRAQPIAPGAFAYQPGGRAEYSTAAAGLLALQVCGFYDDPTVKGAADWLLRNGPDWGRNWFFYGTYYYAQGMYQRGGTWAEQARAKVEEILLKHQEKAGEHAGSWRARGGQELSAGRVYATSLAVLSLSVKYHYLPIYQR